MRCRGPSRTRRLTMSPSVVRSTPRAFTSLVWFAPSSLATVIKTASWRGVRSETSACCALAGAMQEVNGRVIEIETAAH